MPDNIDMTQSIVNVMTIDISVVPPTFHLLMTEVLVVGSVPIKNPLQTWEHQELGDESSLMFNVSMIHDPLTGMCHAEHSSTIGRGI